MWHSDWAILSKIPKNFSNISKIGIGTTSPTSMIQANQSDSTASQIHFTNSTTGTAISDGLLVGINSNEENVFM